MRLQSRNQHWLSPQTCDMLMIAVASVGLAGRLRQRLWHDFHHLDLLDDESEDEDATARWKYVHADVFREPQHSTLLAASVGVGAQTLGTLAAVCLKVQFATSLTYGWFGMWIFSLLGILAGYTASRLNNTWQRRRPLNLRLTMYTALLYPGLILSTLFAWSLHTTWQDSTAGFALPLKTALAMLALWLGVLTPLVLLGVLIGFWKDGPHLPCKVARIPRRVPLQPWFSRPVPTCLVAGMVIFSTLKPVLSHISEHLPQALQRSPPPIESMMSQCGLPYMALMLMCLVVACWSIAMTLTYVQLSEEDHRWWWRPFFASGWSALYVFAYMVLTPNPIAVDGLDNALGSRPVDRKSLVYIGSAWLLSLMLFLITGSLGTWASALLVWSAWVAHLVTEFPCGMANKFVLGEPDLGTCIVDVSLIDLPMDNSSTFRLVGLRRVNELS